MVEIGKLQATCLYPRLNAALRNHGNRSLEPFLPYMKLLLSALYQLPLVQVPTYRGVKLELFEVSRKTVFADFASEFGCEIYRIQYRA